MTPRQQGFTLYELMITIAVAAVIISYGVPTFRTLIQNSRAHAHANDIITALNLGRNEAIHRGSAVTVCSSTNGTTCAGSTDWTSGYVIRSASGTVLRSWPELRGGDNVLTANVSQVRFGPRGDIDSGAAPQLQLALPDCSGDQGRNIAINMAGRIATNRVAC